MQYISDDNSNNVADSGEEQLGQPWLYVTDASVSAFHFAGHNMFT